MTPEDYEQFRSDGWSSRKVLTQAVLRELLLPEGWVVSPENHTEYGGVWPVSLRYVPPHGRHWFMLTSPGEVCDHWMLLLQSASGQRIKCLLRMPVLDTFLINSRCCGLMCWIKNGTRWRGWRMNWLASPLRQYPGVVPDGTRLS